MNSEIRERLVEEALTESAPFQAKIVNSNYPVLGSRMANMRKMARELAKAVNLEIQEKDEYYEEVLLRGLILAYDKRSVLEKTKEIEAYLTLVDTWALTDSFCSTLKVKHSERESLMKILKNYLNQGDEYQLRYAQIMLLSHFLKFDREGGKLSRPKTLKLDDPGYSTEGTYLEEILEVVDRPYLEYYASMGAAWLLAEAFLFFPKRVLEFLKESHLDSATIKLTLRKIRESRIPDPEVKQMLKSLEEVLINKPD